jgi:hypothetical protein
MSLVAAEVQHTAFVGTYCNSCLSANQGSHTYVPCTCQPLLSCLHPTSGLPLTTPSTLAAGYGVYPSEAACCAPGAAFPQGCNQDIIPSAEPCWVVDTYWPSRSCKESTTLCDERACPPLPCIPWSIHSCPHVEKCNN